LNRVYDAVNKRVCAFAPCASAIGCGVERCIGHDCLNQCRYSALLSLLYNIVDAGVARLYTTA
jgi:hypothetical protein